MVSDQQVQDALDYIREKAYPMAKAKAECVYMEAYLKVVKSEQMRKASCTSVNAQERDALDSTEYRQQLNNLKFATEEYERYRWGMTAAEATIEVWRTEQANRRGEAKIG